METPWFASWFDSPYYPILYQNRNEEEAEQFIEKLLKHLHPQVSAHFLDLACGRGRHARFIHQHGFEVTGLDLSPASIADAKQFAGPSIHFKVHDMRDPYPATYDFILNLFTSFGYFSQTSDNLKVLENVSKALKPHGTFVLDFMNAHKVVANLVGEEEKHLDGLDFSISRRVEEGIIVKRIHIIDEGSASDYVERVQALGKEEIEEMIEKAGMKTVETWGNYQGDAFDVETSDRLILFCQPHR